MGKKLSWDRAHASHELSCSHSSVTCHRSASSSKASAETGDDRSINASRPYIQASIASSRSGSTSGSRTCPLACSRMPLESILRKNGDLADRTSRCAWWQEPSAATNATSWGNVSAASATFRAKNICAASLGASRHGGADGKDPTLSPAAAMAWRLTCVGLSDPPAPCDGLPSPGERRLVTTRGGMRRALLQPPRRGGRPAGRRAGT
mmetsp:Transcript_47297/g.143790  ORF Transcript_47297/g.143790 Transcript_47297/m.143790 type:complete len:207 (+) Transcript_47297:760-1380(+)